ncbi:phosphoribosyltransferase-like protein [Pareuzebyella sediminis]|uniref:phosphoribosyltransferase-like protein n=1 Tax=Pareuzebyella sediminis TaxID=2607998 RepID=UPI0011F03E4A|nr:hypothetical protein [Pareuzebyella sediminis]
MTIVESITYLNKVFKAKKWTDRDIDEYVFDNFCTLLDNLNERERELIIELVERYQWITSLEYQEKILSTLESVEDEKIEKLKTVYLFPIIKFEDEGKVKSGTFLMYQIKAFKKFLKKYSKVEFKYVTKFEYLTDAQFELKDNETLYLIDDYIGSGETLNDCLEELRKNKNITNDKLNIIAIAIQQHTSDLISKEGISIYAGYFSPKGLSDFNDSPIREEKIALMLEIEKLIPGGSHFSLGYNGCEALITLARTPDNTFPIFWMKHRIGKKYFDAPFSREETFEI